MFRNLLRASIVTLFAGLALSAPSMAQEKLPLRVAYVPAAPGLVVWVAQDKGFFAEQGLDVSFVPLQNISLVPGAIGKQLDVGMVTVPDLIKASAGGLDVVAISGGHIEVEGSTTNVLVARKDAGISSIKDISGKTVGTPTVGAILHVALLHWMKKEGIPANSIRAVEVPFSNMPDQLEAARIDVAIGAQPFADRMLAAGNLSLGNPLLQIANPVLATLWISERGWAEENKEAAAKWNAALQQSKDFIANDPDGAREILAKYTKLPAPVVQSLELPHFETKLEAQEIDVWAQVLRELDQLQEQIDASNLIATVK